MVTKDTSVVSLLVALVFGAIVATSGVDSYKAMSEKAAAQVAAVDSLRDWKRQYAQLIPVEERWTSKLGRFVDAKDLLTIHTLVSKDAPHSNPDTLVVDKIERVVADGRDLGAQRVCISSMSGGWQLIEPNFPALVAGLQALTARADMETGSITLTQEKGKARAFVSPACLLLRDEPPVAKN